MKGDYVRLRAITPIRVSEEELDRRRERYQMLSPEGVEVELANLPDPPGVPASLDSEQAIRGSESAVVEEALASDPERYDAVLPDCVLDPGLERLWRECPVPAYGILRLSTDFLVSLGYRFGAVTRNRPIGDELRRRIEAYGHLKHFDRGLILDLSFEDIADDALWNETLTRVAMKIEGSPATAVINGCSAVDLYPRPADSVALVDPTALALQALGLAEKFKLPSGRRLARTALTR